MRRRRLKVIAVTRLQLVVLSVVSQGKAPLENVAKLLSGVSCGLELSVSRKLADDDLKLTARKVL